MIELTAALDAYLTDESRLSGGAAESVFLPESEGEIADILRENQSKGLPVTVSGARTGIVGGAVPRGGIVIATERLDRIESSKLDAASGEWRVTLEPGVLLKTLQDLGCGAPANGAATSYFFPVDATETSASLGGMAATNASGALSHGYGAMRAFVRSLRAVLAGGEFLAVRRGEYTAKAGETLLVRTASGRKIAVPTPTYHTPAVKHTAGLHASSPFDAVDLFIGTEGTLGVITQLELALAPYPGTCFGGLAFFPSEAEAVKFVRIVRDEKPAGTETCRAAALEYFDAEALRLADRAETREQLGLPSLPQAGAAVYFEQFCGEEESEALAEAWSIALDLSGSSLDHVWSALDEKERHKLKALRHLVPEEVNRAVENNRRLCPAIYKVGTDLAVPHAYLAEMVAAYRAGLAREEIPGVIFGHIGDNNLHVNMLPRDEEMLRRAKALHLEWAAKAVGMGGTVAAEHGIGKTKDYLMPIMYDAGALAEMHAVKKALDPRGILSPGNGGLIPRAG